MSRMIDQSEGDERFKRIERDKLDALLGWCEVTQCRRHSLLQYFGEDSARRMRQLRRVPDSAGHVGCDGRRAEAAVVRRAHRRSGSARRHVIDVLLGKRQRQSRRSTATIH